MPIVRFDKGFVKQYEKADKRIRDLFEQRLKLFIENKSHPVLGLHKLYGEYSGYCSINVTGDWRAIFLEIDKGETVIFVAIGTHSQLYK